MGKITATVLAGLCGVLLTVGWSGVANAETPGGGGKTSAQYCMDDLDADVVIEDDATGVTDCYLPSGNHLSCGSDRYYECAWVRHDPPPTRGTTKTSSRIGAAQ
jgi:hypothetical protein